MMARKKKPDLIDQALTFFSDKLKNASLEEFIFFISWLGGTYLAFEISQKTVGQLKIKTGDVTGLPVPEHLQDRLGATIQVPAFQPLLADPHLLAISMVASYKFLKSDMGSIASVLGLLSS